MGGKRQTINIVSQKYGISEREGKGKWVYAVCGEVFWNVNRGDVVSGEGKRGRGGGGKEGGEVRRGERGKGKGKGKLW